MNYGHWVTQSQAVFYGKGLIKHIVLTATSAGVADITLYEGQDDAGKVLVIVKAAADGTRHVSLGQGLPVSSGLYVKLGSNVEGVLVLWEPA